ncbi:MAG TPA: hypothetical protein ENI74_06555 [Gammaproteobacteria bacterium]|nr:hypothetical protein [Gammaproteobacteria bacterium]
MKGKQVQKLLSLWLALTLILAPLPALSAVPAAPATGHCPSMQGPAAANMAQADTAQRAMPGCLHCQPDCQGYVCNGGSCASCHGSITSLPSTLLLANYSQALHNYSLLHSTSRTDPPLLRPPLLLPS